jgi:hypothetical protein
MHHQSLLLYYVVVGFASQNILECFNCSESLNFLCGCDLLEGTNACLLELIAYHIYEKDTKGTLKVLVGILPM